MSSDGKIFPVDVEVAKKSITIKTILEDLGYEKGGREAVPLANVNAAILEKVLKWAKYHKDDPTPPNTEVISSWDKEFLQVSIAR